MALEPTSCSCLALLNQDYVFQVQIPSGCYFKKTHHPPHSVGREDAQTDVDSLCYPSPTQATPADGWRRYRTHMVPLRVFGVPPYSPSGRKNSTTALFIPYFRHKACAGLPGQRWVALLGPWEDGCRAAQLCLWNRSLQKPVKQVAGLIKMREEQGLKTLCGFVPSQLFPIPAPSWHFPWPHTLRP